MPLPSAQPGAQDAPSASTPKTYDMRDEAAAWINDPNVHAFYQATVQACPYFSGA